MKRNCEFIDLGEFEMTSPVMRVSDPCYERDVWCCGTVDHCKLGTWEAGVLKTDEGEWGTRCAVLAVRHKDTGPDFNVIRLGKVRKVACKCVEQSFEVGVDSGQAGFFDDAFYQNDTVFEELPAPGFAIGDLWYRHVCDITLSKMSAGVLPYRGRKHMDLFDFNHDGEVSDLERIMGLAAVLSEANPDVEISVTVDEDEDYESMTHDELEERLDELRTQRDTLECEEPDDLDSEAYEEWEEQCEQLDEKIEEIEDLLEG